MLDQPLIGWYLDDDGHETVRPRILDCNMSIVLLMVFAAGIYFYSFVQQ